MNQISVPSEMLVECATKHFEGQELPVKLTVQLDSASAQELILEAARVRVLAGLRESGNAVTDKDGNVTRDKWSFTEAAKRVAAMPKLVKAPALRTIFGGRPKTVVVREMTPAELIEKAKTMSEEEKAALRKAMGF